MYKRQCIVPYGVHVSPKMCEPLWCPCVTSKCVGPLCIHLRNHFKINSKMMQNQWKSTWVGASWAMLAQDDTSLKPSWRKMTERIVFSLIFGAILQYQNSSKINEKMKWFSDTLKNRVFCAGRSQRLQNGVPKKHPTWSFFWNLTKLQNRAPACTRT